MPNQLFSKSLFEVFDEQRSALREEAGSIGCNHINNDGLAKKLAEKYALAIPEFTSAPISAKLDDAGEYATYVHKIQNSGTFGWRPSSSPLITQGDFSVSAQQLMIRFRAHPNSPAKSVHQQIVEAIEGNVAGLAREIPPFNGSLEKFAADAVESRKKFCEDLERRRNELL